MIEVVLVVICVIGLYAAWSIIDYNKKIKESERHNNRVIKTIKKEKNKSNRNPKVSKDQVSNKRKYRNAKKKAIESKVKKNGKK